jgi:hypothetical protein
VFQGQQCDQFQFALLRDYCMFVLYFFSSLFDFLFVFLLFEFAFLLSVLYFVFVEILPFRNTFLISQRCIRIWRLPQVFETISRRDFNFR